MCSTSPSKAITLYRTHCRLLAAELFHHSGHLRQRMLVSRPASSFDPFLQHAFRFGVAAVALERLRGHKVAIGVVRMELQKLAEFRQRLVSLTGFNVLHRQAIAGKGVTGVLLQEFCKHLQAVWLRHEKNLSHATACGG